MTATEFSNALKDELNNRGWELSKKDVDEILDSMGDCLIENMGVKDSKKKGKFQPVPVKHIGRFTLVARPRRKARNPATGESIIVGPSKKAKVTLAKEIRDAVGSK